MKHSETKARIVVSEDGPYMVVGNLPLVEQIIATDSQGGSEAWKHDESYKTRDSYALCRSMKKPFCDGSHSRTGFDGTETASRENYVEQAKVQDGPSRFMLMDAEPLCAFARFCNPNGQV